MASEARKLNPDGYIHTRDADEYQRLRDQALMWQGATEALLGQIGLGAGMSALDVGSGPGAVMRLMANRVGPEETLEFWGGSFIADPFGRVLVRASHDREEVVVATCDRRRIAETRRNWPFLRDRRIDAYGDITKRFLDG